MRRGLFDKQSSVAGRTGAAGSPALRHSCVASMEVKIRLPLVRLRIVRPESNRVIAT
jgi:hypothetical protein